MGKCPKNITDFVESIYDSCKENGMSLGEFCILAEELMQKSKELFGERLQKVLKEKL